MIDVSTSAGSSSWYLNLIDLIYTIMIALSHEVLVRTSIYLEEEERTDQELLAHYPIHLCKLKVIQVQ